MGRGAMNAEPHTIQGLREAPPTLHPTLTTHLLLTVLLQNPEEEGLCCFWAPRGEGGRGIWR